MERAQLRRSTLEDLVAYQGVGNQQVLRDLALKFLEAHPRAFERGNPAGRITASAVVVDPAAKRVLLHHSRRLGRWVQLGGHCEAGDQSLLEAALREAVEESGLPGLRGHPGILDLDAFTFPRTEGGSGLIVDVRYLVTGESETVPAVSPEAWEVRWWPLKGLPVEESVRRAVQAAQARLGIW